MHIIFVCHGNICRSTMAEFVMRDLLEKRDFAGITVSSAATSTEEIGNDTHPGTKNQLRIHGIRFERHYAHQITNADAASADIIVAMDSMNIRNLKRMLTPCHHDKITRLLDYTANKRDVADPWYTGDYATTYSDIITGCEALLKVLRFN